MPSSDPTSTASPPRARASPRPTSHQPRSACRRGPHIATGRYVHEVGFWDNADAYDGSVPSWHHVLRQAGHEAVSIGKLHFRGRPGDDHG